MPAALLALAAGAFGIGTTEFIIMGLLTQVSQDLQISIPTAGTLISGYAIGVAVGAPILTLASRRWPRKLLLLGLMLLFSGCVALCFAAALAKHGGGLAAMAPAFAPGTARGPVRQERWRVRPRRAARFPATLCCSCAHDSGGPDRNQVVTRL